MVRSIDSALSADIWGAVPFSASQPPWATTAGTPGGRSPPHACTVTSVSRASSRARYSTWTPAPPYTSGGYSRLRSAACTSDGRHGRALGHDDDAVRRDGEALAVEGVVDPDLRARLHPHVLVENRVADDRT